MTNSKGRKDVHLLVSADIHRLAKIECAKAGVELSRATEALWHLWAAGAIRTDLVENAIGQVADVTSQKEEETSQ